MSPLSSVNVSSGTRSFLRNRPNTTARASATIARTRTFFRRFRLRCVTTGSAIGVVWAGDTVGHVGTPVPLASVSIEMDPVVVVPDETAASAASTSSADWKRCAGSLSRHRRIVASSCHGIVGSSVRGATGVSRICFRATTIGVSPVNAVRPVKIS